MNRRNILVDIDHTLSNAFHRDPMIGTVKWDEYHAASHADEPLHDMVELLQHLSVHKYFIIAITARPEKWRQLTMAWCTKYRVPIDELLMRADEEFRPSPQMKRDLALARFPDIKNEVAFMLEDRDDVCAAFRELGITVLQVHARRD